MKITTQKKEFYFMDFVQELEIELKEYEKVYSEMLRNFIFTEDEINYVKNEIKRADCILKKGQNL